MKKILALAAVAALTAGVSAYAANPFSDVTADDWAYQAVSDLSAQGVVEGYPDGTFKGERNMTRYELAQIVARLMAKEDQLNAEQQATIDKLAGEYADELANLKERGRKALDADVATQQEFDKLLEHCASSGLFIVPVGELESWLVDYGVARSSNKTKWIT